MSINAEVNKNEAAITTSSLVGLLALIILFMPPHFGQDDSFFARPQMKNDGRWLSGRYAAGLPRL